MNDLIDLNAPDDAPFLDWSWQTPTGALLSTCRRYRFALSRLLDVDTSAPNNKTCVFIMLNPSTADATQDDPTIRRCINFAKRENCAGLVVLNLFAYRATDPKEMKAASNPEGDPVNMGYLKSLAGMDALVIAAWGKDGDFRGRAGKVKWALREVPLYALEINKDGSPKHPLYVHAEAKLLPFNDCAKGQS